LSATARRNGVSHRFAVLQSSKQLVTVNSDTAVDPQAQMNHACGEDSDCINRATKMECGLDCGCGDGCQNQRFQQKQYANVVVIKTEKKGYGLRTESDLQPNDFIFEYIGEVINETAFRRRMIQYDEEGIKHFYFMSLTKGEFIDATKKGNLGRFCNHSCNPNCYVDKWTVGNKLRMGIFAERKIKSGEELVFNYNVDRYGANPQPCYCGEPNCTGFIGGKTQTERATKLSNLTIEALGLEDGDGWDTAVAKRPKKKKVEEDDEEYVNNVQPRALDEHDVSKVMGALRQCKEKWIVVKLLSRIQKADDQKVRDRVVRMHGYQTLKTTLTTFMDDYNVLHQVLDILDSLPRITRNKIQDSNIEETVQRLTQCGDEGVETKSRNLLEIWSKLEVAYRIPRVKRDPNAAPVVLDRYGRRGERPRSRSKSRSRSPPTRINAPTGPKNAAPANAPRAPAARRPFVSSLPQGWYLATHNGRTYYYDTKGNRTWQKPTSAPLPPPPPSKEKTNEQKLQDIILSITQSTAAKEKQGTPQSGSANGTPAASVPQEQHKEKKEKWRSYSLDKQKKLYKNTVSAS
jgi:[histone H3]-lysine36 N-trimethyltransferase